MTRRAGMPLRLLVLVLVGILAAQGCAPAQAEEKLTIGGVEYTEPEFKFGLNVKPDDSVTLADDVVVVPHGAQAVRGVTGDGMTWTLDPKAPGIDQVVVGKVMFLTARGVGRVEAVEKDGDLLRVTISPVEITEIFHDAEFGGDDVPLDLSQMIAYDTGEADWLSSDLPPSEEGGLEEGEQEGPEPSGATGRAADPEPDLSLVRALLPLPGTDRGARVLAAEGDGVSRRPPAPDPNWGGAKEVTAGDFRTTPVCCAGGVGVHVGYDKGGVRLTATMQLVGEQPRASWKLVIRGGRVERAEMEIRGAAGIAYDFAAGTESGLQGNIHKRITLPTTLSFPAVAAGVPFAFTVRQEFIVRTAFSARTGTLKAKGQWSFAGGLRFGYTAAEGFSVRTPFTLDVQESLLDSISGVSVGASGIVLAHRVELKVGIGWETFSVGPYLDAVSSIGVTRGSDLGSPLVVCRGADLNLFAGAGIGYRLPQVVVDVVNFVLSFVSSKRIAAEGSLVGIRKQAISRSAVAPQAKICGEG